MNFPSVSFFTNPRAFKTRTGPTRGASLDLKALDSVLIERYLGRERERDSRRTVKRQERDKGIEGCIREVN